MLPWKNPETQSGLATLLGITSREGFYFLSSVAKHRINKIKAPSFGEYLKTGDPALNTNVLGFSAVTVYENIPVLHGPPCGIMTTQGGDYNLAFRWGQRDLGEREQSLCVFSLLFMPIL